MNLAIHFKAPVAVLDAQRRLIARAWAASKMEEDAAHSLSESERNIAMTRIVREQMDIELLARFFEVDLANVEAT